MSEGSLDPQPFAMQALRSQSQGYISISWFILKFLYPKLDPKALATLSKTSFNPSYLEPSEPPKPS
jgi:hypothetical protein